MTDRCGTCGNPQKQCRCPKHATRPKLRPVEAKKPNFIVGFLKAIGMAFMQVITRGRG